MLFASSLIPSLTKNNTIIRVVIAMQMKWWGMNYFQINCGTKLSSHIKKFYIFT